MDYGIYRTSHQTQYFLSFAKISLTKITSSRSLAKLYTELSDSAQTNNKKKNTVSSSFDQSVY